MIIVFLIIALHTWLTTLVAQYMWTSFILPVTSLATPSFWMMFGFILTIRMIVIRDHIEPQKHFTKDESLTYTLSLILSPLITFIIGWIVQNAAS